MRLHKVVVSAAALLSFSAAWAEGPVSTQVAPAETVTPAAEQPVSASPPAADGSSPAEAPPAPPPGPAPVAQAGDEAAVAQEPGATAEPANEVAPPEASDGGEAASTEVPATAAEPSAALAQAEAPAIPEPSFEEKQRLVGGAPLHNPNVRVHTVQKKRFADRGKHELTLFPASVQVNGKFTQHFGTALAYTYHLHENFALQVTPQYNWYANESAFNRELIDKVRSEAQAASSLLLSWGVVGGVEVTPFYGKFAFLETHLAQFSLVLNAGAGVGATAHQLRPNTPEGGATYGDTGNRFLGSIGGGVRVQFGDRFALRAEVRDLIYTAKVDQVNGCDEADLAAMNELVTAGRSDIATGAGVGGACQVERFTGAASEDVPRAYSLVKTPSSDALNNLGFYAGLSWLF